MWLPSVANFSRKFTTTRELAARAGMRAARVRVHLDAAGLEPELCVERVQLCPALRPLPSPGQGRDRRQGAQRGLGGVVGALGSVRRLPQCAVAFPIVVEHFWCSVDMRTYCAARTRGRPESPLSLATGMLIPNARIVSALRQDPLSREP